MIVYLPDIYPDELVYSWFCRYYVHSGCFSHKEALQELYCKKSDYLNKEFIGNLNKEAMEQIEKIFPLDELVLNHTMFPQYARFIPLEKKREALYRLGHEPCDVHHLFCVLPRNEGEQYLKFCPMCVNDDRETYGETYWHRKHQIRNMSICTKHKCRLMESNVLAKSEQCFIFSPAENYIGNDETVVESNFMMIQFASYLDSVFDALIDFENDVPISAVLYDGMSRTKYLKPSGRSRYTKMLADDINEFYRSMDLCSIASIYQIQKALLGNLFDFTVVCQIAFFLGMEIEELINPSLTVEQIQKEQDSHYMRNAAPIDWELLDMEIAPVLEKFAKGVYDGTGNENGRPERVSEKLVYREMGLQGHQLENMPRCKAIMERYTESYPESWARKIIWAYRKLEESGETYYWTDIRKISGVKKKKNNGATLTGITASKHEGKGGVCIYLDNYYEYYCDNRITLDEVTEDVYDKLMEHRNDLDGVDMKALWDWEAAKTRIRAKLVNREMNCEFLKKVPHRDFLDLAVIYYVTVEGLPEGVNGAFTVSDGNMEIWKKGEDDLYQMAVSNMRLDGEPVFEDMEKVIRSMVPEEIPDLAVGIPKFRFYVQINPQKVFGAVELLDGSTLKEIGDELGCDFIVLPSSLHESIIIPADVSVAYQELAEMVTDINRNVVSVEERLSDHVYLYEREEGILRIAA